MEFFTFVLSVLVLPITSYLLYLYFVKYKFWREKGVNGPIPIPIVSNLFRKPTHELQSDMKRKFGNVFGIYEFETEPVLVVIDLELIKKILIKDFHIFTNRKNFNVQDPHSVTAGFISLKQNEEWKRVRSIVTPTFTSSKMRQMSHFMIDCANDIVSNIKDEIKGNPESIIESKKISKSYSLDVIGRCCFATKTNSFKDENDLFLKNTSRPIPPSGFKRQLLSIIPSCLSLKLGLQYDQDKSDDFFVNVTAALIENRTKTGIRGNDFLQALIDARVDNDEDGDKKDTGQDKKPRFGQLTKNEVIAQAITFFNDGHETVANSLKYAMYELAINQDVQERLFQELSKIENLDYDNIVNNVILDSFFNEVLRKYPPAILLERIASQNYRVENNFGGKTSFTIPKGSKITIPIYAIHHDEDNFPEPQKFNLDRFLPENKSQIKQCSFLPFGAGNRNCVAMRFAYVEGKIFLAKLILSLKIKTCDKTKLDYEIGTRVFLMSKPIYLKFEIRQ